MSVKHNVSKLEQVTVTGGELVFVDVGKLSLLRAL